MQQRTRPWLTAYDGAGLAVATAFVCLSLTPSLLPRGPGFQGWLSGIVAAAGYGIGVLVRRCAVVLAPRRWRWTPPDRTVLIARTVLVVGALVAVGVLLVAGRRWQRQAHEVLGQEPPGITAPLVILGLATVVFVVLVGAARLLRRGSRALAAVLARRLPVVLAAVLSVVLIAVGVWTVFDQVVLRVALGVLDSVSSAANDKSPAGLRRPTAPERSGSPASYVRWDDLGYEGKRFVAGGPQPAQFRAAGQTPARTPIRVYVGLRSTLDADERAQLAVDELVRTGAFDRAVLCIVTTTGTGWVDERAATPLEYLYGGDTAIVATQYSYLPSPVSFVFDDDAVEQEGRDLYEAVHARWSMLPPGHRPRLLLYGESLGTNGGQAPFAADLTRLRAGADGALFTGPPSSNPLWDKLVAAREPGSPQRLPVFGDGTEVRFAARPQDIDRPRPSGWTPPRVLFLQHASDPVVWWTPRLLLQRPAWLTQPRGPDVSGAMSWYPIVTFVQVTADLAVANHVPLGAGHRYGGMLLEGWAAIAPPPGWTDADTTRLAATL